MFTSFICSVRSIIKSDDNKRAEFVNEMYNFINKNLPKWRKTSILKKTRRRKNFILATHKNLLIIYFRIPKMLEIRLEV